MQRTGAGLIVFGIVTAAALGLMASGALWKSQPGIAAAIARQEGAKAALLEAQAEAQRAAAAEAWIRADAHRLATGEIAAGIRWRELGAGIAVAVLLVGAALAAVTWASVRARVVYPDRRGMWPILIDRRRGSLVVHDTGRALGPVTIIGPGGDVAQPLPGSESAALQLATQAQAAGVMVGIAGSGDARNVAARVGQAAKSLPAPTFANNMPAGSALRFAYVKTPGMASSAAARELQDLHEFIRLGQNGRGLARRDWIGQHFAGSGNRCTRTYYDAITARLARAGCLGKDGSAWAWQVDERESLDAFSLLHADGGEDVLTGE